MTGKELWGQDEEKMDEDGEKMMGLGDDLCYCSEKKRGLLELAPHLRRKRKRN